MTHRSPTQTQHRPGREKTKAKELAAARSEAKKLGREVARLRKRLEKYETAEPTEDADPMQAGPVEPVQTQESADSETCGCGASNWAELLTPAGTKILFCRNCKIRKTIPL